MSQMNRVLDRIFFGGTVAFALGLAHANVVASMSFAWMSGSAVAAVGGLGEIEVKAIRDNGCDSMVCLSAEELKL